MKPCDLEFNSRRSPVLARGGMVAASQPLAAAAGMLTLQQGGSAADAAVAVAAALNVTEPGSTGIGGDAFCLYYEAATHNVYALNGSGRAPAALTLERLHKEGFTNELPARHPYTVTTPGACAAWCDLSERFGRLPLATSLAPAIRLACEGYPVAPLTAQYWRSAALGYLSQALNGRELTIDGRAPLAGEVFRNPSLARTLQRVAEGGKAAFYQGEIAAAIAAVIRQAGGCLNENDLGQHTSTWEEPLSIDYRGIRFWECPPNGQGLAALLALNILEGFDLAALDPLSPERLHLVIEALRLAFSDVRRHVADPAFYKAPLTALLGKPYAERQRQRIDPRRATPNPPSGMPVPGGSDTVYFTTADAEGNACSFINSNYMGFGTGIVPAGWGFSLQNRGHNFNLQAGHPNALQPGKRPYHTIIPAMATYADSGQLYASYGVMGGFMQPQGHTQVALALVDDQLDPQAALDRPRLCLDIEKDGRVALEEGIPVKTMSVLAGMGHTVEPVGGLGRALFGRGQIIHRDPANGVYWGASDPRADGCALALF